MLLEGSASNSVKIIPNAWGITDVTLNGKRSTTPRTEGAVEKMDNSTAYTIKFTWKSLW